MDSTEAALPEEVVTAVPVLPIGAAKPLRLFHGLRHGQAAVGLEGNRRLGGARRGQRGRSGPTARAGGGSVAFDLLCQNVRCFVPNQGGHLRVTVETDVQRDIVFTPPTLGQAYVVREIDRAGIILPAPIVADEGPGVHDAADGDTQQPRGLRLQPRWAAGGLHAVHEPLPSLHELRLQKVAEGLLVHFGMLRLQGRRLYKAIHFETGILVLHPHVIQRYGPEFVLHGLVHAFSEKYRAAEH
mmetsp:Transcript_85857/g.142941  ORF Transcript_85857/g.142941 Transcript_85857/m.142941 type:complete len:242 (-) Transcript_85857:2-727(-)